MCLQHTSWWLMTPPHTELLRPSRSRQSVSQGAGSGCGWDPWLFWSFTESQHVSALGVPANCMLQTTALLQRVCAALDQHSFAEALHALHGKKKLLSRCCDRPHGRSSVQYPSRPHQRTLRCLCKCWAWYHSEIMLQTHSEVTLTNLTMVLLFCSFLPLKSVRKVASGLWCKGSEGSTLSYRKTMRCG